VRYLLFRYYNTTIEITESPLKNDIRDSRKGNLTIEIHQFIPRNLQREMWKA